MYNELVKKVNATQTNDTSNLIKNIDYNTKVEEVEKDISVHDISITTQEFNKLTTENCFKISTSKATEGDIGHFIKKTVLIVH